MTYTKKESLLDRAVNAWRGRRALMLGDLVLDTYVYGETVRVSREAPVLIVRKQEQEFRLGGGANTAANLAALGVQTQVLGVVGRDASGTQLCQMLTDLGADTTLIRRDHFTTPVKTRVLAGAFGTSKQQVLRIDEDSLIALADEVDHGMAADLRRHARDVDVIVVSDYGLQSIGTEVLATLRALAAEGHTICVDSRYRMGAFTGVTAVTPNVPEAEGMVGFALTDQAAVHRAGAMIMDRLQCHACLLTQGRHGMTLFERGRDQMNPPLHVTIVGDSDVTDVTGAGDTVIATLGAALAGGLGMINGMLLANCAAGVAVTRRGCVQVTPAEVLALAHRAKVVLQPWNAV